MDPGADEALAEAQRLHASGEHAAAHAEARRALEIDPEHAAALEFLAIALVARKRLYVEGLALIDRAVVVRPDDAGIWYARGWCYEFTAHELARRPDATSGMLPTTLYATAADSFRRCLALHPQGKLLDDAQDLLDHVENELLR